MSNTSVGASSAVVVERVGGAEVGEARLLVAAEHVRLEAEARWRHRSAKSPPLVASRTALVITATASVGIGDVSSSRRYSSSTAYSRASASVGEPAAGVDAGAEPRDAADARQLGDDLVHLRRRRRTAASCWSRRRRPRSARSVAELRGDLVGERAGLRARRGCCRPRSRPYARAPSTSPSRCAGPRAGSAPARAGRPAAAARGR